MTSLDIGRPVSSEPKPYGTTPDGAMLLYFGVGMLVLLTSILMQRACPGWEFEVIVTERHLTAGRPGSRDGADVQVPLSDITDVYLDPTMPRVRRRIYSDSVDRVRRRRGRSADGVRRGPFEVRELGDGWLYTTADSPPYLIVRTADTFVIVNYPRADRTRALHQELTPAWRNALASLALE